MGFLQGFADLWVDLFNYFFVGTNWYNVGYGFGILVFAILCFFVLMLFVVCLVRKEEYGRVF